MALEPEGLCLSSSELSRVSRGEDVSEPHSSSSLRSRGVTEKKVEGGGRVL